MSKLIPRKVAAVTIICFSSLVAHSQAYYNDEYCDIGYADCDQIDTELIGDPNPGIGRCGTVEVLSTLNSAYATASGTYPSTATLTQHVAGATSGVWYPWTYTELFFPPAGPPGSCTVERVSWSFEVEVAVTYGLKVGQTTDPEDGDPIGIYKPFCSAGTVAICPLTSTWNVEYGLYQEPYSVVVTDFLAIKENGVVNSCIASPYSAPAGTAGPCK